MCFPTKKNLQKSKSSHFKKLFLFLFFFFREKKKKTKRTDDLPNEGEKKDILLVVLFNPPFFFQPPNPHLPLFRYIHTQQHTKTLHFKDKQATHSCTLYDSLKPLTFFLDTFLSFFSFSKEGKRVRAFLCLFGKTVQLRSLLSQLCALHSQEG